MKENGTSVGSYREGVILFLSKRKKEREREREREYIVLENEGERIVQKQVSNSTIN